MREGSFFEVNLIWCNDRLRLKIDVHCVCDVTARTKENSWSREPLALKLSYKSVAVCEHVLAEPRARCLVQLMISAAESLHQSFSIHAIQERRLLRPILRHVHNVVR